MTLADKRKVIEVLLCASGDNEAPPLYEAADEIDIGAKLARVAGRLRSRAGHLHNFITSYRYHHDCTEAAYRLIESSPTLRREWFGGP